MNYKYLGTFGLGAVLGAVISGLYFNKKYKKIADDEIKSTLEEVRKYKDEEPSDENKEESNEDTVDVFAYDKVIMSVPYKSEASLEPEDKDVKIEILNPLDYGNYIGEDGVPYAKATYYLYTDGVLASDENDVVSDIDELFNGSPCLDMIGCYEPDSLHVRNHKLGMDIEILRSSKSFKKDVMNHEAYYTG